jgi:hypothetical protein
VPWRDDAAAAQRVIFCVYHETEELRLRAKVDEFEIATRAAGHDWALFDLTDSFPTGSPPNGTPRATSKSPTCCRRCCPSTSATSRAEFETFLQDKNVGDGFVVALQGVGSLFGFLKVKEVVDKLAPMVKGRLLVFFPGSYEDNNYRLLDGYDGWNYLAVPITADKEF